MKTISDCARAHHIVAQRCTYFSALLQHFDQPINSIIKIITCLAVYTNVRSYSRVTSE